MGTPHCHARRRALAAARSRHNPVLHLAAIALLLLAGSLALTAGRVAPSARSAPSHSGPRHGGKGPGNATLRALASSSAPGIASGADRTAAARVGSIRETALGSSTMNYLFGLALGPDGNIWFANLGCMNRGRCTIGRITADGLVSEFSDGLHAGSVPTAIATGRGGDLWFTDEGSSPAIGRITPSGRITEFSRGLNPGSVPFELVAGSGGDIWFTDQGKVPAIGRITRSGRITEFSRGLARGSVPFGITRAPGGRIWFTDRGCTRAARCAIGHVNARGKISESSVTKGSQPLGIAAGPSGTVWFADHAGAIARVAPGGKVTEFSRGLDPASAPVAISSGPDGNLWFTAEGRTPAIGRISPRGAIREYSAGLAKGSQPAFIGPVADGEIWFSDEGGPAVLGRVRTEPPSPIKARPAGAGSHSNGGGVTCGGAGSSGWGSHDPSIGLVLFDGLCVVA